LRRLGVDPRPCDGVNGGTDSDWREERRGGGSGTRRTKEGRVERVRGWLEARGSGCSRRRRSWDASRVHSVQRAEAEEEEQREAASTSTIALSPLTAACDIPKTLTIRSTHQHSLARQIHTSARLLPIHSLPHHPSHLIDERRRPGRRYGHEMTAANMRILSVEGQKPAEPEGHGSGWENE
jgi:hypothetical protein